MVSGDDRRNDVNEFTVSTDRTRLRAIADVELEANQTAVVQVHLEANQPLTMITSPR